jgi:uncharacterized protein (DUF1330 family)
MAAYVIVDISIHDHTMYEEYKKLTPAAVAAFDGKFVIRGGETIVMEGSWDPKRVVVLQFPTVKHAKDWWGSEIYSKARAIRQAAATTNMIIVEGL